MKKFTFFLLPLVLLAMVSCNKEKNGRLEVSDIRSSGCLYLPAININSYEDSIITHYDNGILYVEHQYLWASCCFEKIDVRIRAVNDTITINEVDDGDCDCACLINNSFQIHHLTPGHHVLVFNQCYPTPKVIDINI